MSKLYAHQVPTSMEAERIGATPVQFLPSMMLSWRAPRMAREGVAAKSCRDTFADSILLPQETADRPAP